MTLCYYILALKSKGTEAEWFEKAEWGYPIIPDGGYGDDPKDTDVISKGIFYYDYLYKNQNSK